MTPGEFSLSDLGLPDPTKKATDLVGSVRSGCRVERLLGQGGMGSVYLARRESDGAQVVIKVLAPELARDVSLRIRFQREWEALSKIQDHPNVVRVHGVSGEGSEPHIVMEFVPGVPLLRLVQERGRVAPAEAARIARDVARGLTAVHTQGLIHRDVKPENVLLTPDGTAKLVDFGLVKDVFTTSLTRTGQLMGTAHYMSPEQWGEGQKVDARADVFALGATLYHLLVGQPPFLGADVHEVADKAASGDYARPREVVPEVPPELEQALCQMLMADLRFRTPSMQAAADDLERVLRGQPPAVVCFHGPDGRRYPLVPGDRFTLGADPACEVHLPLPGVDPRHAQLSRKAKGYVLRDLKSAAGTAVNDQPLKKPCDLADGDRVRLGGVELRFDDPCARAAPRERAPVAQDVRRRGAPEAAVQALVAARDPRAALYLLERLAPCPAGYAEVGRALGALLGAEAAQAAVARRHAEEQRLAALVPGHLAALTQQDLGPDPARWLGWWCQVRASAPEQVVLAAGGALRGPRPLSLRLTQGASDPVELDLATAGVVLLGRDERCTLRLQDAKASRLHALVAPLARRYVVRDEQSSGGTLLNGFELRAGFLDPGASLVIGECHLVAVAGEPPAPRALGPGRIALDVGAFDALVDLKHPACTAGLVGLLAPPGAWLDEACAALFPRDPAQARALSERARALYAPRARRAREILSALAGQDLGPDPAPWRAALAARGLGPQVLPEGWLEETR